MLEKLKNIRSYHDLTEAVNLIQAEYEAQKATLKKLLSLSTSAGRELEIGLGDKPSSKTQGKEVLIPSKADIAVMSKYAKVMRLFHASLIDFTAVRYIAKRDYGTVKAQAQLLEGLDIAIAEVKGEINDAAKGMTQYAYKHIPPALSSMFNLVCKYVDTRFSEDMYTRKMRNAAVFPVTNDNRDYLYITVSLRFSNLKLKPNATGKTGKTINYMFPTFMIVLTAVVDIETQKATYHVNVMPEFKIPGNYKVGSAINENNVVSLTSKSVQFYNVTTVNDRIPIPAKPEIKSLVGLPNIQRVKVMNDRVALLLKPNLTESQVNSALSAVINLLNHTFKDKVSFSVVPGRYLNLNEKVEVAGPVVLKNIKPFAGKITTPLLNSEEAKIALNNDLTTFIAWSQSKLDAINAESAKMIKRKDALEKTLKRSPMYNAEHHTLDKEAPKSIADTFKEFKILDRRFKADEFKEKTASDVKRTYDKFIREGIKSHTIDEAPKFSNPKIEKHMEKFQVLHIELHGTKLDPKKKKEDAKTLRDFEACCEIMNLDFAGRAKFKDIFYL